MWKLEVVIHWQIGPIDDAAGGQIAAHIKLTKADGRILYFLTLLSFDKGEFDCNTSYPTFATLC